ncbi:MAG: MFS transporter [Proteobacteria bacterium]|nr:MFS transporter [Pseudomonadota bacterium]
MSPNNPAAVATAAPWRPLLPVFVSCFAFGLQAGTGMPLVPLALEHRGVDNFVIGIVSAAWGVGMIATAHFIPAMAARLGAVRLISACVLLNAAISVVFAFTSDTALWFGLCVLSGVVGGVPWVVSEIWINLVTDESRRGRAVAVYSTLVALGLAVGPLVLQVAGVYGPRPFLVNAALGLLVILPLLPNWRLAPPIRPTGSGGFARVIALAPVALLAALACGLGGQGAFSFLPIFAVGAGVAPETGAMWLSAFVIGNLVLQWPIGWMADHLDRRAVLAGCALASAALTAALPLIDATGPAVLGVLLLWGGVSFAIYSVGLALLGQRFRGGDIARANAALTSVYTAGGMIGPPIAGTALDLVGRPGFGLSIAGFYLVAGVGAVLALRRRG